MRAEGARLNHPTEQEEQVAPSERPRDIFRKEALDHYRRSRGKEGDVLRLSPRWTRWTYWLLVFVTGVMLLFFAFFRVGEYISGPAVIRSTGHNLTAAEAVTVAEVRVQPGQLVAAEEILVRFESQEEEADLARANHDYELGLAHHLHQTESASADLSLSSLRSARDLAARRLEARLVRSPAAGIVRDVRIRPGQHVSAGQSLLRLGEEDPGLSVVAILPGQARPSITEGMSLRLTLSGYAHAREELRIDSVGDEVIGPAEARRVLGPEVADALAIDGSVVLVRGTLPHRAFLADGRSYDYHDGMQGRAEVRVRSESILVSLIPWLRTVREPRS